MTSTSNLTDGKYIVVFEGATVNSTDVAPCAFNGALTTLDAVSNYVLVTPVNGEIAASDAINAAAFTFTASNGAFLGTGGKYFGNDSNSNGLTSSDSPMSNTITFNADGSANIVSTGGAYLRFNATSGQTRFRYYKSSSYTGQKPVYLYKLTD